MSITFATGEAPQGRPLLALANIAKRYGGVIALEDVSFAVRARSIHAILGENGAGKSTLIKIVGGVVSPDSGRIEIDGKETAFLAPRDAISNGIDCVFQELSLIPDLTVAENLDIPLSYRNVKKSERESIVCDALDKFQIVAKKDLFPNQLSGGQQQLVAVARAVIASPKLILADEPTGNLHTSQGEQIMELFKKLNADGTTIVQVTHSEKNATYGNRIIRIGDGWIEK